MSLSNVFTRTRSRYRALKRDDEAATAVEFAMVAGPFFFLLFGLIEICLVFIVSTTMEHAAEDAARSIRTGAFNSASTTAQQDIIDEICAEMVQLFDCQNNVVIQVDSPTTFATTPALNILQGDGTLKNQGDVTFNPGTGGSEVVLRIVFRWQLITPLLSTPLANYGNDSRLIQATVAFKNEPF